jgi:hypothetical protein
MADLQNRIAGLRNQLRNVPISDLPGYADQGGQAVIGDRKLPCDICGGMRDYQRIMTSL